MTDDDAQAVFMAADPSSGDSIEASEIGARLFVEGDRIAGRRVREKLFPVVKPRLIGLRETSARDAS